MPGCPWQGGLDSAARQRSHLARQRAAAPQSMHLPFARRSARRCFWAAAVLGIIPPVVRVKPILWTRQEPNLGSHSRGDRCHSQSRTHGGGGLSPSPTARTRRAAGVVCLPAYFLAGCGFLGLGVDR